MGRFFLIDRFNQVVITKVKEFMYWFVTFIKKSKNKHLTAVHFFFKEKIMHTFESQKVKISAIMLTSYFFSPKKVGKKGFG